METISHGRRQSSRYPLQLHFRYRVMEGLRTVARGTGTTAELSSSELRFSAARDFPVGTRLEFLVEWPARFGGFYPMELSIVGLVFERSGNLVGVHINSWRFLCKTARRSGAVIPITAHGWARCRTRGDELVRPEAAS